MPSLLQRPAVKLSIFVVGALIAFSGYVLLYDPGILRFRGRGQPVQFQSGDVALFGTLLIPRQESRAAIVLVHGSGPAPIASHPAVPYRILANAFLRRGIAVLLYDKRGSGRSNGNLDYSTYDDLANDVSAAASYLKSTKGFAHVGLFARSEGGWVAPLAAKTNPQIDYVIINSGGPVRPYDETIFSIGVALKKSGFTSDVQQRATALATRLWRYYERGAADSAGMASEGEKVREEIDRGRNEGWLVKAEALPWHMPPYNREAMRAFAAKMFYDPKPTLEVVRQPLLGIFGANDDSNPTAESVEAMNALIGRGRKNFEVRVFTGVGHAMTTWKAPQEGFYAPGFLDLIGSWAQQHNIDSNRPKP